MSFRLKDVKVKDILQVSDLVFPEHSISCIIGESGSGKTTLFRLLNHLDSVDEGEIWYKGQTLSETNPIELRRNVVMVPQTPVIFKGTVKDNLQIGLILSNRELKPNEKLKDALHITCLDKDLSQDAENLSGGEKQRLVLARAILMNPSVLLLDEPTSSLDDDTADKVMERLSEFVQVNTITLIMITHSQSIAEKYAHTIIEMTFGNNPEVKEAHKVGRNR